MILGLGNERNIHSPWFQPWAKGMTQIILPTEGESPAQSSENRIRHQ